MAAASQAESGESVHQQEANSSDASQSLWSGNQGAPNKPLEIAPLLRAAGGGIEPQPSTRGTVLTHGTVRKDFACFTPVLGTQFVVRAVECVSNCRVTERLSARTWWDNYAKLLWEVLEALARYAKADGGQFDPSNIELLAKYISQFDNEVRGRGHASSPCHHRPQ